MVVIFGLLLWSKPWDSSSITSERTITATGESIIKATPDEFTFYPYFEETGDDEEAIKTNLTKQANEAVEELKELGVDEDDISLDASSYDRWIDEKGGQGTLNIRLTIVTDDSEVVQAVQNYLLTLDVKGQISPQATFSQVKQKELDAKAVEEASEDARAKAEKQAQLFGAKLGKPVTITQGSDSIFLPYANSSLDIATEEASASSLPVLPGQNEYRQTVKVVYELK